MSRRTCICRRAGEHPKKDGAVGRKLDEGFADLPFQTGFSRTADREREIRSFNRDAMHVAGPAARPLFGSPSHSRLENRSVLWRAGIVRAFRFGRFVGFGIQMDVRQEHLSALTLSRRFHLQVGDGT